MTAPPLAQMQKLLEQGIEQLKRGETKWLREDIEDIEESLKTNALNGIADTKVQVYESSGLKLVEIFEKAGYKARFDTDSCNFCVEIPREISGGLTKSARK